MPIPCRCNLSLEKATSKGKIFSWVEENKYISRQSRVLTLSKDKGLKKYSFARKESPSSLAPTLPALGENEVKRALRLLQTCTWQWRHQQGLIYPSYSLMIKNLGAADAKTQSYDAVTVEKQTFKMPGCSEERNRAVSWWHRVTHGGVGGVEDAHLEGVVSNGTPSDRWATTAQLGSGRKNRSEVEME